jgi:hypothetical protein
MRKDESRRSWSAGCGESYLSGVGSAGRKPPAERQQGAVLRLHHYWRFVDCEALELKALSQGGDEIAA